MSKFTINLFCISIVSLCASFLGIKESDSDSSFRRAYSSHPFFVIFMPANSSVFRFTILMLSLVPLILSVVGNSQILSTIIQGIMIFVIHHFTFRGVHDLSMHENGRPPSVNEDCSLSVASAISSRTSVPFMTRQFIKINIVYNRYVCTIGKCYCFHLYNLPQVYLVGKVVYAR